MRGQIFTIEEKTIFTFGGATSVDKAYRTEHISWWKEEEPSFIEYNEGLENLRNVNNKVDIIITHTCPSELIKVFDKYPILAHQSQINSFFDQINETVDFKRWYFGHFHDDINLGKYRMLYNDIEKIEV